MPIDLYSSEISGPGRLVQLVAAALDVKLNFKPVDIMAGEHLTHEYLKINPQHTVPTIVDDGFALSESRAIARYLANKYGSGSCLYPQDPKSRALVDQRLDFDMGTLSDRFSQYFYPQVMAKLPADPEKLKKIEEALGFLNTFLEGKKYVAGPALTIADLALVVTVSNIDVIGISLKPYPNVVRWYELIKSTAKSYEEANGKGARAYKEFFSKLKG